jgi:hypothetical protein
MQQCSDMPRALSWAICCWQSDDTGTTKEWQSFAFLVSPNLVTTTLGSLIAYSYLLRETIKSISISGWNNASSDYRDTDESFVTVALHSEELHLALALKVREIGDKVKKAFSSDQKFLCRAMGVGVPFLPVSCADEYKLSLAYF